MTDNETKLKEIVCDLLVAWDAPTDALATSMVDSLIRNVKAMTAAGCLNLQIEGINLPLKLEIKVVDL
jgi:hypothetical protein